MSYAWGWQAFQYKDGTYGVMCTVRTEEGDRRSVLPGHITSKAKAVAKTAELNGEY